MKKNIDYDKLWEKHHNRMFKLYHETTHLKDVAIAFAKICIKIATTRKKHKVIKEVKEKVAELNHALEMPNVAVFLDRDGVINKRAKPHHYIRYCSDLKRKMFPNVETNIKLIKKKGYMAIIISNQAGINKGQIKKLEYNKMIRYLTKLGIDMVYTCPHDYEHEPCNCRKPSPNMLIRASKEWKIDLKKSWMVGDDETDMESGKRAGCQVFMGTLQEFVATVPLQEVSK